MEVVEDEADRRLRPRRRDDAARALPDHEDAPVDGRRLELRQLAVAAGAQPLGRPEQVGGGLRELPAPLLAVEGRRRDLAALVEEDRGSDLGRDLGQIGESLRGVHAGCRSYHREYSGPCTSRSARSSRSSSPIAALTWRR